MFSIRALQKTDLSAFLQIYQEIFPDKNLSLIKAQAISQDERAWVYLAEDEQSRLVGFAYVWHVLDEIQILDFGVLPSIRRQGIGKHLLSHLYEEALANQFYKMTLEVRVDNAAALALYQRNGFIQVGLRKHYYPDGCDALLLDKIIEKAV